MIKLTQQPRSLSFGLPFGNSFALTGTPSPSPYTRTAFVDEISGDDLTAELNNPNAPYASLDSAIVELNTQHPAQTTTISVKTDINNAISSALTEWANLLHYGCTLEGYTSGLTVYATLSFNHASAGPIDLTLKNLAISDITDSHAGSTSANLGVIRGYSTASIATLDISGSDYGHAGIDGSAGSSDSGNAGTNGSDGDPPGAGTDGYSATGGTGTDGTAAGDSDSAWSITLLREGTGTFTINNLIAIGSAGSNGGAGGSGGIATGGNGGNGGNSTSGGDQDGGAGGNGGAAYSTGGNGGNGGDGGDGGTITRPGAAGAAVSVLSSSLTGGAAGLGGAGGAGNASGGAGGDGGDSAGAGSPGANGATGVSHNTTGSVGTIGTAGSNGSFTT